MKFLFYGFIVCFVHDGLFAHLLLQLPPQYMLWLFHIMMMWTYQMKEYVLMQQASFEPQCSIDDLVVVFLLYARGNTSIDLGWVFFWRCHLSWATGYVRLSCFLQFYQLGPNEVSCNDGRGVFSFTRMTRGTIWAILERKMRYTPGKGCCFSQGSRTNNHDWITC